MSAVGVLSARSRSYAPLRALQVSRQRRQDNEQERNHRRADAADEEHYSSVQSYGRGVFFHKASQIATNAPKTKPH